MMRYSSIFLCSSSSTARSSKVAVVGACGAVGRTLSLLLRCSPYVHDLRLVDALGDGAKGVAADLAPIDTPVFDFSTKRMVEQQRCRRGEEQTPAKLVSGYATDNWTTALRDVDLVISAAGAGRTKGMSTFDKLFEANARVAVEVACAVAAHAPASAWFAVTTSPLNCILPVTAAALREADDGSSSSYEQRSRRVFGMTSVNIARARSYYLREVGKMAPEGTPVVIGGQAGLTIVPLFSTTQANAGKTKEGKDEEEEGGEGGLSEEVVELLTVRVNEGGGSVTKYAQPSSLACAKACCEWVEQALGVIHGKEEEITLTAMVEQHQQLVMGGGQRCPAFFSSPLRLQRSGVVEVLPLPALSTYEEDLLDRCIPDLEKNIKRGVEFFEKMKNEGEEESEEK